MKQTDLMLKSFYIPMRDNVRLAVSVWLPGEYDLAAPRPAVLMTTRYWRAMGFRKDKPELQKSFPAARYFWDHGYILTISDARGTGASFGTRESEIPTNEINDIGEIIQWVAEQPWCDGQVATTGTSYTANTTFMSFVTSPPPLKVGVSRAVDFDVYRQLMVPGGILNTWMTEIWGKMTEAQDQNDVDTLFADAPEEVKNNILGVRPVDEDSDGSLLTAAVEDHKSNFNVKDIKDVLQFIDDSVSKHTNVSLETFSTYFHKDKIQANNTPIVYRAGWYDSGTQLGAMNIFTSFSNPKRIIVGPWNHDGRFRADPFQPGDGNIPEEISQEEIFGLVTGSLDTFFKKDIKPLEMNVLEYYTLGENKWKTTKEWPLPQTRMNRFYLSADNTLTITPPGDTQGNDIYQVDPTTGSGKANRWHTQMGGAVCHPDRQKEDKKLLVYDTLPLKEEVEVTGHPVIHLFIRSTAFDGHFFVYLEAVNPDGRVHLVTEGQLRAIHRKISNEPPPYTMFGPYHTFKRADALPLIPGEVAEISFDLFPISMLFKKGWKIRIAIAGADKDVFEPIPDCETPTLTIERNIYHASYLEIPIISN